MLAFVIKSSGGELWAFDVISDILHFRRHPTVACWLLRKAEGTQHLPSALCGSSQSIRLNKSTPQARFCSIDPAILFGCPGCLSGFRKIRSAVSRHVALCVVYCMYGTQLRNVIDLGAVMGTAPHARPRRTALIAVERTRRRAMHKHGTLS